MKEDNQRKSGIVLSYLSIIATTIIELVYTPFLIHQLGQSEYGLYSMIYSIIGYLTILDLGFGNAIVVYTSKYRAKKEYEKERKLHGMFFVIFCVLGLIAGFIALFLGIFIGDIFGNTMTNVEISKSKIMMIILSLNLVITFGFTIYSSIITAYEQFNFQKILSIINTLLKPILMIPLLFLGYKSITMCVVVTLVNSFVLISNYFYCKKRLNIHIKFLGFDKALFKEIFAYSFFIFLGIVVDKINWSVDQIILGAVSGTIAVSVYSVASKLNTLFINLSTAVSGVFLPKMSKLVVEGANGEKLTNEMIKIGRIQYYIIFLMATGLILVGKDFFIWWAGPLYETSYYISLLLIIPACFPLIQNVGLSIMQAMNKYKFKAIVTFIMALFNIVISFFLAIKYGAIGAAFGTAISLIVCNIFIINIYYKVILDLNVIKFWKEILKMTTTFLIPLGLIIIINLELNLSGFLHILIIGSLYVIIFSITSYFITMNTLEKNIVKSLVAKMFHKRR